MKLYLARHGEYIAHGIHHLGSLNEKGRNDIETITNFIRPLGIEVANILHSGKVRAEQTADILAKGFIYSNPITAYAGINPDDDVSVFADTIHTWEEDVLVVGHLPFMARLVDKLIVNSENKEIVMFQPGSLVCLERKNQMKWMINWMLSPDIMKR